MDELGETATKKWRDERWQQKTWFQNLTSENPQSLY